MKNLSLMSKNPMKWSRWLLASVLASLPFAIYANPDEQSVARGKQISAVCAACHLPDGRGLVIPNVEARPRLTGLDQGYFVKQLQDFKHDRRVSPTMKAIVASLTEEQMVDLAAYFASLPVVQNPAAAGDADLFALGEQLVSLGDWDRFIPPCMSCHGVGAKGVGSFFPNLRGQSAFYISQQLTAWKKGSRHNDVLSLMKPIADRLTDREVQAVALWLSHQNATDTKELATNSTAK